MHLRDLLLKCASRFVPASALQARPSCHQCLTGVGAPPAASALAADPTAWTTALQSGPAQATQAVTARSAEQQQQQGCLVVKLGSPVISESCNWCCSCQQLALWLQAAAAAAAAARTAFPCKPASQRTGNPAHVPHLQGLGPKGPRVSGLPSSRALQRALQALLHCTQLIVHLLPQIVSAAARPRKWDRGSCS